MILTWGYGNRSVDDLRRIVEEQGIARVVDVRRSRRTGNPRVRVNELEGIRGYLWWSFLGNTKGVPEGTWQPASEQGAHRGLVMLSTHLRAGRKVLLMCAEADHQRCHRTEVARRLAAMVGAETGRMPSIIHL